MKGIADTGFLVAFANRRDRHHQWAKNLATQLEAPLLTCEAVLAESAFHLRSVAVVAEMASEGLVELSFNLATHLEAVSRLAKRFADQQPDLADLCLIRMSEIYPKHVVITVDRTDFGVYRRNGREVIPLLCPPG